MNYYSGKRIWITGASSGIGSAMSLNLARSGARIIVTARNREALQALSAEAGSSHNICILPGDMERTDSLHELSRQAWGFFDGLDIIILNAGMSHRSFFRDTTSETGDKILQVNLLSQIEITRIILPLMEKQGSGLIVSVSSLAGKIASPMRSYYSAAKHALFGFFNTLRVETAGTGVKVSVVVPGFVSTNISQHALNGDGSVWGKSDRNQQLGPDPETAARKILKKLSKGRREIFIGYPFRAILALVLGTRMPAFFDRVLKKITYT